MATFPYDGHVEGVSRSQEWAGSTGDVSYRQVGGYVDGECPVDPVKYTLIDHHGSTPSTLFPRLEHEPDASSYFTPPVAQQPGRTYQHRYVGVVAAGMSASRLG
jgi:hypothetical protein